MHVTSFDIKQRNAGENIITLEDVEEKGKGQQRKKISH